MPFYVRLVSHTQKSGMPTDITGQKNVRLKAFLCTEWTKAHHRYRRHFPVYQPSYIWRLVQGMAFWGTNQVVSGVWYRGHLSGVPTKLYLAFGTGNTLLVYQPSYIWRLVQETPFWCTNQAISGIWYRGWPSGVPTKLYLAFGTGNTLLVYQPSYIWRLVQETPFWCTNQAISGVWYRGWPSGVPTEGGTIVGTEKPPQEYND